MRVHPAGRLVQAWVTCALVACAPAPQAQTTEPAPQRSSSGADDAQAAANDSALALAKRLPTGADRCSIARPYRIDDRQKVLAKQVMQTDPLAWDPSLAVIAFASADYARDDGPSAHVMWLRSALPIAELQRRLDTKLTIEWIAGASCSAAPCPMRGEILDGAVLLSSERWPTGADAGAEAHCLRAAHDPRVLELSAARLRRMPLGELLGLPLRSTTSVQLASDALISERVEIMAGRAEASERAMRARGDVFGLAASEVRVDQEDVLVRTTARYRWDDLEMLAMDAARLAAAERAARTRSDQEAPPLDGPLEPTDYMARAALLLHQLTNALAPERNARREALHALLERGLAEHPEHEPLALLLFELRMAEPERRTAARELAERFAALPGADPRWQDALRAARVPIAP
jgi:hypothetical protein